VAPDKELRNIDWRSIQEQMLDAVLLLAHRVSGLGVESELMRASPNFDDDTPRFVALSAEALDFVNTFRAALDNPSSAPTTAASCWSSPTSARKPCKRFASGR
jgi:site-specific recombinase